MGNRDIEPTILDTEEVEQPEETVEDKPFNVGEGLVDPLIAELPDVIDAVLAEGSAMDYSDPSISGDSPRLTAEDLDTRPSAGIEATGPHDRVYELLVDELLVYAARANARLRAHLTGVLVIHLTQSDKYYLFDWAGDELKTGQIEDGASIDAECRIHIDDEALLDISRGEGLNPQIAMLSDKVVVEGRLNLAIYFFNLLAPQ